MSSDFLRVVESIVARDLSEYDCVRVRRFLIHYASRKLRDKKMRRGLEHGSCVDFGSRGSAEKNN